MAILGLETTCTRVRFREGRRFPEAQLPVETSGGEEPAVG